MLAVPAGFAALWRHCHDLCDGKQPLRQVAHRATFGGGGHLLLVHEPISFRDLPDMSASTLLPQHDS